MHDADKGKYKNNAGVSWHALPQGAETVALPLRQVAQSVEAFPDDAALDAWKQQSSAVLSLMTGETTDSSTSQSLPIERTSIPASWHAPSELDELRGKQQAEVKVISWRQERTSGHSSFKNAWRLFAMTLTSRTKDVASIKQAFYIVQICKGQKDASESETPRDDYDQRVRTPSVRTSARRLRGLRKWLLWEGRLHALEAVARHVVDPVNSKRAGCPSQMRSNGPTPRSVDS